MYSTCSVKKLEYSGDIMYEELNYYISLYCMKRTESSDMKLLVAIYPAEARNNLKKNKEKKDIVEVKYDLPIPCYFYAQNFLQNNDSLFL